MDVPRRPGQLVDDELLEELSRHGDTRTWEAGSVIVTEGEVADSMCLVHEGELRVVIQGEGSRVVELDTPRPGEFFGELMLHGERRSATVEAITRVRLTRIARGNVQRLLHERPDLAFYLIQRLVNRVRVLTRTVSDLVSMDVYRRVIGLFDALAVQHEGRRCVLNMSQQRLAERVGASRPMINRLLHDMATGGYIELQRGCIVLLRKPPPRW